jgi:hypothetical protein
MNRLANIAVIVAISTIGFSGVSHADSLTMNGGPEIEKTLLTYTKPFSIMYLENYDNSKFDNTSGTDAEAPRTTGGIQHIQASIAANKGLVERLQKRGVHVKDIVNAQQAADGSIMFTVN